MNKLWEAPRGRFGAVWDFGGGGNNVTTAKTDSAPWATQQPYLQKGFETAGGLLAGGTPNYYPNATYVPMSGTTAGSLQTGEDAYNTMLRVNSPSMYSLTPEAQQQTYNTMKGDYLTQNNPYFSQMLQNTFNKALPTIDSAFAGGGRGISGARDAAVSDAWAGAASNLGYQDYSRERQNQIAAINAAPAMAQTGLAPLQQLGQIGAAREGYAGQELQDALKRYDFDQNKGWNNLSKYMATVGGGSYGSQQTSMVPQTSNPWLTAAGAAGSAATILGSLFGRQGAFS